MAWKTHLKNETTFIVLVIIILFPKIFTKFSKIAIFPNIDNVLDWV